MLENVKMLLGIADDDTSKDKLINYYINTITTKVLKHCKIVELIPELNQFIENKVFSIMKSIDNTASDVKSVQRGDTTISYNQQKTLAEAVQLTTLEKQELNEYKSRKVKML
ncbi:phage head-tail connector protein [Clostridium tyrobutyricum]|uniref:phage head-tail connector protein n=1 Tax=Clostridium tyrobutyricum TaxID=1519 RepID=UPI002B1ED793|nr:phage head-tail connector protein [Clostridium tyrobutyricum]MEA5008235.1 phage head-tail connector protein [Clostridium tyrobutyricum]